MFIALKGMVGWCEDVMYLTSPGHPNELAYSWARPAILVTGKSRGGMFWFLLFLHFHYCFSFFPLFHLLYYSSISFLPFSGRRHKMTHNGWCVVKPQHNQSIISLKGHYFYNLFIFTRTQGLAKLSFSLNKWRNDGRRGISTACCHSHLCYMSCIFTRPDKKQASHGLLSLLLGSRVFFPCWCVTGSSILACVQKGFLSLPVLNKLFFPCWWFTDFLL